MSEPSDATPESVDVAAIMVEIREGIEERRRQGVRTPDEIEGLIEERLRAYGERAGIHPQLIKQILHPSHEWNISVDYLMRTQRPGIVGAAILGAKRAVRPFVRLYTDHILKRQEQLNLYLMYFLQDAVRQIVRLELEVAQLRKQVDEKPRGGGQA